MRILATADLHINYAHSEQIQTLKRIVKREFPDVVLIAGDVHDCRTINPYKDLSGISKDINIIFCLGNHEFAFRSVAETLNYYNACSKPDNVKCLDVCDYVDVMGVRFCGNVLWYDGSLSKRHDVADKLKNIEEGWLDSSIRNFDPVAENNRCINQIKTALNEYTGKSVLLTHTVPHYKLNAFSDSDPNGIYNIYSGIYDLFKSASVDVNMAICGHTHRPVSYYYDNKIECINVGNDYGFKSNGLVYDLLEI